MPPPPPFDLSNPESFPTFAELPQTKDPFINPHYNALSGPLRHWCLLVEIVQIIPYMRPMYEVKDKTNRVFIVVFYLDNGVQTPAEWQKRCRPGGVMTIMYAASHVFMDGQVGVRVEKVEEIKMLPCGLEALFRIGSELNRRAPLAPHCSVCGQPADKKYGGCGYPKYCSTVCQTNSWRRVHRQECVAYKLVADWKTRDWDDWDYEGWTD